MVIIWISQLLGHKDHADIYYFDNIFFSIAH